VGYWPTLLRLCLQVLNVQLQSEVKRMAALAGMTGQDWLSHSGQVADTIADQVGSQKGPKSTRALSVLGGSSWSQRQERCGSRVLLLADMSSNVQAKQNLLWLSC
jgi:hypothetical protein